MKNEAILFYLYTDTFYKRTNDHKPTFERRGGSLLNPMPYNILSLEHLYDFWKENVRCVSGKGWDAMVEVFGEKIVVTASSSAEYITFQDIFGEYAQYYNGKGTLTYQGVTYSCKFDDYESKDISLQGKKIL